MANRPGAIRVLMVDDERDFLEATAPALTRRGFCVEQAGDGFTALAAVRRQPPEVVVLDVKMPGMDGVEVFQQIRQLVPEVPVVMLTGHGNIQQAFESSREGVFEYLVKPCEVDRLAGVLHRAVEDVRQESPEGEPEEDVLLLLVDDEVDFIASLSPALERRRIQVTSAVTGDEALAIARRQLFDVALIDVRMPGMEGLTLLRSLRALDRDIEVIVLTGHPSMQDAVAGMKAGAFDFLSKPQPVEVLARRIRSAHARRLRRVRESREREVEEILRRRPD